MKNSLRTLRLNIGKKLMDRPNKSAGIPFENIKKILIVRSDGKIGDNIVSSFIFREIKKQRPDIAIHVVLSIGNLEMLRDNPYIDKFYVLKNKSYASLLKMARLLRKEHYDVLFEPTVIFRNRDLMFTKIVGAAINIGYDKDNYKSFNKNLQKGKYQAFEIYSRMLLLLGFKEMDTNYELATKPAVEKEIETGMPGLSNEKVIAINLFGASRSRKFDKEKSIALINIVLEKYPSHKIILLSYPAVYEFLEEIIKEINSPNLLLYPKTTTIFHSIALIKKTVLVISPDTAIVHIAEALKKPLVAFYSNDEENFIQWRPRYNATVLRYTDNVNNIDLEEFKNNLPGLL